MPKRLSEEAFEEIIRAVSRMPDGGSLDEIASALSTTLARRTLQRRLNTLIKHARLLPQGVGRATRYRLVEKIEPTPTREAEDQIKVSNEAQSIREIVRLPIQQRTPVGYNRSLLEHYEPNHTSYLSKEIREHLAKTGVSSVEQMPAGTYARQILDRLLIDLSWNSSRLEGNTYSLLETETLLRFGKSAENKDAKEAQMILNHKSAIEFLVENAGDVGFNRFSILNLHAILSNNLLGDPQAGGRLRTIDVGISGTVFHPLAIPQSIEEYFDQILLKASAIQNPFEQAMFVMVHLPYLQPFEDVNKRVSRLAANIPLIRRNLVPLSFVDVPQRDYVDATLGVYELTRVELLRDVFIWAYERSAARYAAVRQSLGEPDRFRLTHRDLLRHVVSEIVRQRMNRADAIEFIRREAVTNVPKSDVNRFVETAETEILSLHEGNFARYRLRPSEYQSWRSAWR